MAALLWLLVAGAGTAWAISYYLPWTVGDTYRCTQGNGGLYSHWGNSSYGWDFGLPAGAVVRASAPGKVTGCRNDVVGYVSGSWGNYVLIEHADGTYTRYAHLITGSVAVSLGETVGQGERIGLCGNTGASDGVHLHFQREGADKMSVPLSFADAGVPVEEGRYTSGNVPAAASSLSLVGSFVFTPGPYVVGLQLPVTFTVRNTGASGLWDEIILGVRDPWGRNRDQLGAAKVTLLAGASREFTCTIALDATGTWTAFASAKRANFWEEVAGQTALSLTVGATTTTTTTTTTTMTTAPTTATTAPTTTTIPAPQRFVDVTPQHAYFTGIQEAAQLGMVSGYERPGGGAEFRPDRPLLRAQLAKVLCVAFELQVSEDLGSNFIDLGKDDPESLYPHEYVAAMAKAGMVTGKTPLDFGPWDNVSRAQMITMVVRAAHRLSPGLLQLPPSSFTATLGAFSATHAANARLAEYNGLLKGLTGFGRTWDPWAAASRGEVAQVLWRWRVMAALLSPRLVAPTA